MQYSALSKIYAEAIKNGSRSIEDVPDVVKQQVASLVGQNN